MQSKYFLITEDEILDLGAPDASANEIIKITVTVMARPYREPSAFEVIGKGIWSFLVAVFQMIDTMTDPPKKNNQKKGGKNNG